MLAPLRAVPSHERELGKRYPVFAQSQNVRSTWSRCADRPSPKPNHRCSADPPLHLALRGGLLCVLSEIWSGARGGARGAGGECVGRRCRTRQRFDSGEEGRPADPLRGQRCGLTKEQFDQRWMTLGYNRQKNQGSEVEFPPGNLAGVVLTGATGKVDTACCASAMCTKSRQAAMGMWRCSRFAPTVVPILLCRACSSEGRSKAHGTMVSVELQRNLRRQGRMDAEVLQAEHFHEIPASSSA